MLIRQTGMNFAASHSARGRQTEPQNPVDTATALTEARLCNVTGPTFVWRAICLIGKSAIKIIFFVLLGLLVAGMALADGNDASALMLANSIPDQVETPRHWRTFVEGAALADWPREENSPDYAQRLSLDTQVDSSLADSLSFSFADRLDANWPAASGESHEINTIKEAYVGWKAKPDLSFSLGRINVRNGVAIGYNPTDFFRANAVRSVVSLDPSSLRDNRQGSVMLRGQQLWDTGSITLLYAPKLSSHTSDAAFDPDVGATNGEDRWLISVNQQLANSLNPQFLLFKDEKAPVQMGLNLSGLVNEATVAYLEWSGGRSESSLTQALQQTPLNPPSDTTFHNRISSGLTYTTLNNIALTLEYEYDGSGLDKTDWDSLRAGSPLIYGQYRQWLLPLQDSPTRQAAFFYGRWQDALIDHLDLSGMERYDINDYSRVVWVEARYHWSRVELALQGQHYHGQPLSHYGASPEEDSWQLSLRYYF
jgi:hypothetical protein